MPENPSLDMLALERSEKSPVRVGRSLSACVGVLEDLSLPAFEGSWKLLIRKSPDLSALEKSLEEHLV